MFSLLTKSYKKKRKKREKSPHDRFILPLQAYSVVQAERNILECLERKHKKEEASDPIFELKKGNNKKLILLFTEKAHKFYEKCMI